MPTTAELNAMADQLGFGELYKFLPPMDRALVMERTLAAIRNDILADLVTAVENIEMRLRNAG